MVAVDGNCLVKMETVLNLWVEEMSRLSISIESPMLSQKALLIYQGFSWKSPQMIHTEHLVQGREGFTDLRIRLDL